MGELPLIFIVSGTARAKSTSAVTLRLESFAISMWGTERIASEQGFASAHFLTAAPLSLYNPPLTDLSGRLGGIYVWRNSILVPFWLHDLWLGEALTWHVFFSSTTSVQKAQGLLFPDIPPISWTTWTPLKLKATIDRRKNDWVWSSWTSGPQSYT